MLLPKSQYKQALILSIFGLLALMVVAALFRSTVLAVSGSLSMSIVIAFNFYRYRNAPL